jgi:Arc/MetJ-type ribon-helix-helix transcriptional regulator
MVPNKPPTMTEHTAVRLPPELLERVDGYCEQVAKESGYRPTRASVIRRALELLLAAETKAGRRR